MVDSNEIMKNVVVVALVVMMLGVFSPYLFPDRRRIVNINHYIILDEAPKINITLSIPEQFPTFIYNNLTHVDLNYGDFHNQNITSSTTIATSSTKTVFQSFFIDRSCNLTSLVFSGTFQNLKSNSISIWNATTDITYGFKPQAFIYNLSTFNSPGTVLANKNITSFSKLLNVSQTTGNLFFFAINSTGVFAPSFNTTYRNAYTWSYNSAGSVWIYYELDLLLNLTVNYFDIATSLLKDSENALLPFTMIGNEDFNTNSSIDYSQFWLLGIRNSSNGSNGSEVKKIIYTMNNLSFNTIRFNYSLSILDSIYYFPQQSENFFDNPLILSLIVNSSYLIEFVNLSIYINHQNILSDNDYLRFNERANNHFDIINYKLVIRINNIIYQIYAIDNNFLYLLL